MPILAREPDVYPHHLLDDLSSTALETKSDWGSNARWRVVYTLSRREKNLMRRLRALNCPHYCPIVPVRRRSPRGRVTTSYQPLFSSYVFLFGTSHHCYLAKTTKCVSRILEVPDGDQLADELNQVQTLVGTGAPVTAEARLQAGRLVQVRSGPFVGCEGTVVQRRGGCRLVVAVTLLNQGASVEIDEADVEPLV